MIADFHNDFLTKFNLSECNEYLKKCELEGVTLVFASIFTSEFKGNKFEKVKKYINKAKKLKTKIKLLIHIEDIGFLTKENLDEFLSLGVYSCGLTWNGKNVIGGGAFSEGGLTKFGAVVVKKFFENNILVDLAHANKQTFWDVIKLAQTYKKPVVVTHACFSEVNEHPRNIDKLQIKAVIKLGGLVGMCLVSEFIDGSMHAPLKNVKNHINWFYKNFGKKHLAFGTDFNGTEKLPRALKGYGNLNKFNNTLKYKNLINFAYNRII